MNERLLKDLAAWETNELSADDLVGRHGQKASDLVSVHERLVSAAASPGLEIEDGWEALLVRIDGTTVVALHPRNRRRRAAILALAAAMLIGGSAFALSGGGEPEPVPPAPAGILRTASTGHGPGVRGFGDGGNPAREEPATPTADPQDPEGDGAPGGAEQGDPSDQTGEHPGQGNDGLDNGKDEQPDPDAQDPAGEDPADDEPEGTGGSEGDEGSEDPQGSGGGNPSKGGKDGHGSTGDDHSSPGEDHSQAGDHRKPGKD